MLMIQVKSGRARMTDQKKAELKVWADESGARVEVWFFKKNSGLVKEVIADGTRHSSPKKRKHNP